MGFITLRSCTRNIKKVQDPSSQIGAVIVGPGQEIRSTGFNGFPRKINELDESRWERPNKYFYIMHGERNAIINAARNGVSCLGCKIYVTGFPCHECAKEIIQSGIIEVIYIGRDSGFEERWQQSIKYSKIMLIEAGVIIRKL